ncbi:ABC transporter ATP-binding protein [Streptomyces angustmyceticus]|uniref:ABC transporter ATP-binding protein n=1 Tax=Streptomyces angustmyceticus TaxID=285578 RepID=UPI00369FA061
MKPDESTTDDPVISVRDLSRDFGGVQAVQGLSFDVVKGRITGFLGPNGAGKTTTLRMVLGLTTPTKGRAHVFGRPYGSLRSPSRRVGASLESAAFLSGQTGRNHLRCYAGPAGCTVQRIDELLDLVGLTEASGRPVSSYSTGMKQRLSLATALLGDPELLILDEPANGLDPEGILWLRRFLRDFVAPGRTVLLSSHLLREMERTIDDVLLLHRGRIVHAGNLEELLRGNGDDRRDLESAFMSLIEAGEGGRP